MENKEKSSEIESLSRNEWLEYIEKLIGRENSKHSRLGISIWVVIAAMAFLLVSIIDIVYSKSLIDVQLISKLIYFYIMILLLFYLVFSMIDMYIKPNRGFTTSYVGQKRNTLVGISINLINLAMLILLNDTSIVKTLYFILFLLLCEYNQILEPIFLEKDSTNYWISFMKVQLFKLRFRVVLIILLYLLCIALVFLNINSFLVIVISKQNLLMSLYLFSFISLVFILLYQVIGSFELEYLKYIESQIIFEKNINEIFIEKFFSYYLIGNEIISSIKTGLSEKERILEEVKAENNELEKSLDKMIADSQKINDEIIEDIYKAMIKSKTKYIEMLIFDLNALSYAHQEKRLKSSIPELNTSYKQVKGLIKDVNHQLKQTKKIKAAIGQKS